MLVCKLPNSAVISLLVFLLVSSCKYNKDPLKDFADIQGKDLVGEEIKFKSDSVLYNPFNFQVYDTLGVFNDNTGEAGFSVVDLRSGALVKKFAFSGDKPSEFDINAIFMNKTAYSKRAFSILQTNPPCKIYKYDWDSVMGNALYRPAPLYYPHFLYLSSFLLNDSTIFGQLSPGTLHQKMFGVTNISSNKLIAGVDFPRVKELSSGYSYDDPNYYNWLIFMLNGKLKWRPDSKFQFAFFSSVGAVMQIVSVDDHYNFKTTFEKAYYLPSFDLVESNGTITAKSTATNTYGFSDIAVTRDKIYALFNGQNSHTPESIFCKDILIYGWDGKPLGRLSLDKKCRNIAIDESDPSILYGLYGTSNIHVIKYRLP